MEMTGGSNFKADPLLVNSGDDFVYHIGAVDTVGNCYTFTIDAVYQGKVFDTKTLEMSGINDGEDLGCRDGFESSVNIIIPKANAYL